MKISSIGLKSILGENETNLNHAVSKINEAMSQNPDVIVLPELFSTGFFPKDIKNHADKNGEKTKEILGNLAKNLSVNIVAGSIINEKNGKFYNTSFTFNRSGNLVSEYSKTHLFTHANEDSYFSFGENLSVFELDGVKCGIIICYDLRFAELIRILALKGVEVLFVVASWPLLRLEHLRTLAQARAIENQFFLCLSNATSNIENVQYAGHSMIINPWGEILSQGDENEHIINANVDLKVLKDIRESINIYKDRKTNLYKLEDISGQNNANLK